MNTRQYLFGVGLSFIFSAVSFAAEIIPDFYAEPGISQFRDGINTSVNESIDPLSGTLHFVHTDGMVPGNGGLDISIVRSYTSMQGPAGIGPRTVTGIGWTNHFGRVLSRDSFACTSDIGNMDDNPVIELQDGSRFTIALSLDGTSGITKERWRGACARDAQGNFDPSQFIVYSPQGLRYDMAETSFENGFKIWHATRITDPNDNGINITYKTVGGTLAKYKVIDVVTSNDGRRVQYNYANENSQDVLLSSIRAHGQTWTFDYIHSGIANYYYLSQVTRPDGELWEYDYYTVPTAQSSELYSMRSVTYPHGAVNTYTYQSIVFDFLTGQRTTSVKDKVITGAGTSNGTWSYAFAPGDVFDNTTVTTPNGQLIYKHYGVRGIPLNTLWRIGLLVEKQTVDDQKGLLKKETYEWARQLISFEKYTRPTTVKNITYTDDAYYAPIMTKQTIEQDGSLYVTEYSNHDEYGNPGTIIESGDGVSSSFLGAGTGNGAYTKRTDLTYFYNTDKWIIKKVKNETIQGVGSILRSYDFDTCNLLGESEYGVVTTYTYHPSGDVKTMKNPRGFVTTYNNYKRGIPQQELMPESVTISRVINDRGTVASITNGRNFTTNFTYDSIDRLTSIDYPIHTDVSIAYTGLSFATLTRGAFQMLTRYDGIGQTISVEQKDTSRGVNIVRTMRFNALGQKVFQSYPYDGPIVSSSVSVGTSTDFDILDRPLTIVHPDTTKMEYEYLSGNRVLMTNERLFPTTYYYRSYGDPAEKSLIQIDSPEAITTIIERNTLDQMTKVTQGIHSRDYGYDSRYYLVSRTDPEIGLTEFGRNAMGNIVSKTVNGAPILTQGYDGLDRLKSVAYAISGVRVVPNSPIPRYTSTIDYTYDKNSNITEIVNFDILPSLDINNLVTINTFRNYAYDERDNETSEKLRIELQRGSNIFTRGYETLYSYTGLDFLQRITYPKGTTIDYTPDALGRATTVAPYVTNVTYHPSGTTSQIIFQNGQISQTALDVRLRPSRYQTFGNSNDVDLTYLYDGVGNVTSITDGLESQFSRGLTYDGIDRLSTASGNWGAGNIDYDAVGNITSKRIGSENLSYAYDASNKLTSIGGARSYIFNYDFRGNIAGNGNDNFYYDFSDRIRYASGDTITYYNYDGNGQRVSTQKGNTTTDYFYANNGNLLGEYNPTSSEFKEYAYLGSQLVAVREVKLVDPVANAGSAQFKNEGDIVNLNGAASVDSDGVIVAYNWRQISGPNAVLNNSTSATPNFIAPEVQSDIIVTFELTVTDDDGLTSTDTVDVTILDATLPPVITGLSLVQGDSQNTLSWNNEPEAQNYNVYWSTASGVSVSTGTKITNVSQPYIHAGLINGIAYYYIVTGVNSFGESEASNEVSIISGENGVSTPLEIGVADGTGIEQRHYVENPDGTQTLYFSKRVGSSTELYTSTYTPGVGWNEPIVETDIRIGHLSSDSAGNVIAIYYDLVSSKLVSRHKKVGQPWGELLVVSNLDNGISERLRNQLVALSDDGSAIAFWRTTQDYRMQTSRFDPVSNTWSAPIAHTQFGNSTHSTMHLKIDATGNAIVSWIDDGLTDDVFVAVYNRANNVWGGRVELHRNVRGAYGSILKMSDNGHAILAWQVLNDVYLSSYTPTLGWTLASVVINDAQLGSVEMDASGNGIVVWDENNKLYAKRFIAGSGLEATAQLIGYGDAGRSDITYDNSGNILVTWTYYSQPVTSYQSIWVNRFNALTGWGSPIRIEEIESNFASLGKPTITSVNTQGALISWTHFATGGFERLYGSEYVYFGDGFTLQNSAPIAIAAATQDVTEGLVVMLDASQSFDQGGVIVSYEWQQISGSLVTLINANTVTPSFTAPFISGSAELLSFKLTVTDDRGSTASTRQLIVIRDLPSPSLATILSTALGNVISWEIVSGADSYNIYWSTQPNVTSITGTLIQNVNSPYTHGNLVNNQDYYYIVTAVNVDGESKSPREYKATWKEAWQDAQYLNEIGIDPLFYDLAVAPDGDAVATWGRYDSASDTTEIFIGHFTSGEGWDTPSVLDVVEGRLTTSPKLVTNSNGNSAAVWRRTDGNIYAAVSTAATGWTTSELIISGEIIDLGFEIDAQGNMVVVWRSPPFSDDSNINVKVFSINSGWGPDVVIGIGDDPRLDVSKNGNAIVAWEAANIDLNRGDNIFVSRYIANAGWSAPEFVLEHELGLRASHRLQVTLNDRNDAAIVFALSQNPDNATSIRSIHYDDITGWGNTLDLGLGAFGPNLEIANDEIGNVFATWLTVGGGGGSGLVASRYEKGASWAEPTLVDLTSGRVNALNIAVNANGLAMIIWNKTEAVNRNQSIHVSRYVNGAWKAPDQISESFQRNSNLRVLPPVIGISDQGEAIAMWRHAVGTNTQGLLANHYREPVPSTDPLLNNTVAPVVTAPVDFTYEATAITTRVLPDILGTATAEDDLEGSLPVISNAPVGQFSGLSLGTHRITWSAIDSAGNVGRAVQYVTIVDTTPPVLTVPSDITVITDTNEPVVVYFGSGISAFDIFGPNEIMCNAPVTVPGFIETSLDRDVFSSIASNSSASPFSFTGQSINVAELDVIGIDPVFDNFFTFCNEEFATGLFPVGTTIITWMVEDGNSNVTTETQIITVVLEGTADTTAPVITPPADITIEATAVLTPVVLGSATAVDNIDGVLIATADNIGPFPLGPTTVTWNATDAAGNVASATQLVTVVDTTPPVITVPAVVSVGSAILDPISVSIGIATATDIFLPVAITSDGPALFPIGSTTVTWTATDPNGNSSSGTQLVTVNLVDTSVPVITPPADITIEATAVLTPVVLGSATAVDNIDGVLVATVDNLGPFLLGPTTVTWSATDAAGNVASAAQLVTVVDTSPPVITVPAAVSVDSAILDPIAVSIGVATATDIFLPVVITSDAPALFPIGSTTVTWTATDPNGNSSSGTQLVSVNLITSTDDDSHDSDSSSDSDDSHDSDSSSDSDDSHDSDSSRDSDDSHDSDSSSDSDDSHDSDSSSDSDDSHDSDSSSDSDGEHDGWSSWSSYEK